MNKIFLATCAIAVTCFSAESRAQDKAPPDAEQQGKPAQLALTLDAALGLARRSSPAAMATPLRVREAEASRVDAAIYPRHNPLLDLELGPRLVGEEPRSVVFALGLSQTLDLGGGPGPRLKRVDALVGAARGDADAALEETLRAVAHSYLRGLWARERVQLAVESQAIARSSLDATQKRLDAGDATALEINVARGAYARTVAERMTAEATLEAAKGELRALLGLVPGADIGLDGSLATPLAKDVAALLAKVPTRGELRALAANVAEAEAEGDLAAALAAPQLTLGARYELEDEVEHTILGTISMTLPIFDHAQGSSAQAAAKAARAKAELDAKKAEITVQVDTAARVVEKRTEATDAFAAERGVESFTENLALAVKGYQEGETSLAELLLVRRELIETEGARIDRLLELRAAEVELLYAAGRLP